METVKDHASAFLKTAEYLQNLGADGTPKPKREPTVYDAVKAGYVSSISVSDSFWVRLLSNEWLTSNSVMSNWTNQSICQMD